MIPLRTVEYQPPAPEPETRELVEIRIKKDSVVAVWVSKDRKGRSVIEEVECSQLVGERLLARAENILDQVVEDTQSKLRA